jgi:hypothetical protein
MDYVSALIIARKNKKVNPHAPPHVLHELMDARM